MPKNLKNLFTKHKKKILIIIGILILSLIGYKNIIAKKNSNGYTTAKAEYKDLSQIISASGKIKSDEEVSLKFQTSGMLAWVGVKAGDKVNKWQAIASLDKKELEKKLKQELLDYMNERWDREQTDANYLDKSYDAATLETIRRTKDKAQFDLDRVVLDVEISDIALKYATLITPIEGVVTKIDSPYAGVNITPSTAEFVVSNPNKLIFSANVDEGDIGKVKTGQNATLTFDAYPDTPFEVMIDRIEFTPTLTSGGGTAYAVKFTLPEDNTDEKYKLGMNGDVEIITDQRDHLLVIPNEALRKKGDTNYVWLIENNKPVIKDVEIGYSNDNFTEITKGLENNAKVITSGFKILEK